MLKNLVNVTMCRYISRNISKQAPGCGEKYKLTNIRKFMEYRGLLRKLLNLNRKVADQVLYSNQQLLALKQRDIIRKCQTCMDLKIDVSDIGEEGEFLTWSVFEIERSVMFLRDLGVVDINACTVSRIKKLFSLDMYLLKAATNIPPHVKVSDNILKCLHTPPEWVPPLRDLGEDLMVYNYMKECWRWYFKWRLNIDEDKEHKLLEAIVSRAKYSSFSLLRQCFDCLHYDIGLSIEKIKLNPYMLMASVTDLKMIINEIGAYGAVSFKELIQNEPKLCKMEYENVAEVVKLLRYHNFSDETVRRTPVVLLLDSEVLAERLHEFECLPELRALKHNTGSLQLILNLESSKCRLEYLRKLKRRCITLSSLVRDVKNFRKYLNSGIEITRSREIKYYLSQTLHVDPAEILPKMKRHPFWIHVDMVAMAETATYLFQFFERGDILSNPQLLFYPRKKVMDTLNALPELREEDFSEKYTPQQILSLVLYDIEEPHHFKGDGIWPESINKKNDANSELLTPKTYPGKITLSKKDFCWWKQND